MLSGTRFLTTSVDPATGRINLLVSGEDQDAISLSTEDAARLRRHLADAIAGSFTDAGGQFPP